MKGHLWVVVEDGWVCFMFSTSHNLCRRVNERIAVQAEHQTTVAEKVTTTKAYMLLSSLNVSSTEGMLWALEINMVDKGESAIHGDFSNIVS